MTTREGIFLALEGIDGAGKTTQVKLIETALREAGEDVLVSKEPTAGVWGQKIRESATTGRMPLDQELEAFIKDREEHLETKILPALKEGRIVILDRYFYSTIAYQGARGGNIEKLDREVRELAVTPDAVFVLDVDPVISTARICRRDGAPNEFEKIEELVEIRKVFQWLCDRDPVVSCVDSALSPAQIMSEIIGRMISGVLKDKRCAKSYGCDDAYYCGFRMTETCDWWRLRNDLAKHVISSQSIIDTPRPSASA